MKRWFIVLLSLYFMISLSGCCCNCAHKAPEEAKTDTEPQETQEAEQPAENPEPAQ